jgi:hypothetical protein
MVLGAFFFEVTEDLPPKQGLKAQGYPITCGLHIGDMDHTLSLSKGNDLRLAKLGNIRRNAVFGFFDIHFVHLIRGERVNRDHCFGHDYLFGLLSICVECAQSLRRCQMFYVSSLIREERILT